MSDVDLSEVYALIVVLGAAGAKAERDAEKAVDDTGEKMLAEMRANAPVETGELRDDIRELEDGVYGSTVPHGFYQEFGTSVMSPQPWAWPASTTAEKNLTTEFEKLGDPFL